MAYRTYGWVQNPSSFASLKKVVSIFDARSEHYQNLRHHLLDLIYFPDVRCALRAGLDAGRTVFSYAELVGSAKNAVGGSSRRRSEAVADGLIQISIAPQQAQRTGRQWTDNWTADGFLRWAVTLNFVAADRDTDRFAITRSGQEFSAASGGSLEEKQILIRALMSYPPATRLLEVLSGEEVYRSKFYMGQRLGFIGEGGFTAYGDEAMQQWFAIADPATRQRIRTDIEGTSDKYARTICTWLKNLGLVQSGVFQVSLPDGSAAGMSGYRITPLGRIALNRSKGYSRHAQAAKFLMWEFLATKGPNRSYVRTRRAMIIRLLQHTMSLQMLMARLREIGFHDAEETICHDLEGLRNIGLRIEIDARHVRLRDRVCDFTIPDIGLASIPQDARAERLREYFMQHTQVPHGFLALLDIAFNSRRHRDFEIMTMKLFLEVYKLGALWLGGAGQPDGILYDGEHGVIVDTKAYAEGYGKSVAQKREMVDYLTQALRRDAARGGVQWWLHFPQQVHTLHFLWVSGKFVRRFDEQLRETAYETQTTGAALSAVQLLLGADDIICGRMTSAAFLRRFNNHELRFRDLGALLPGDAASAAEGELPLPLPAVECNAQD